MGLIALLLSFTRAERNGVIVSDAKIDPGGGPNLTSEHFAPSGDDSNPLPGDFVVTTTVPGSGRQAVVGYIDPNNAPITAPGEKRIYARNVSGATVVSLWLKADGTAVLSNASGTFILAVDGSITSANSAAAFTLAADGSITGANSAGAFQLQTGGDFVVNGAKITSTGDFVDSAGKTLRTHTHAQGNDSNGDSEVETEIPS